MLNKTEYLLTVLQEELAETSQRASKALRFGLNEQYVKLDNNNADELVYEFNDVMAIMELLEERGDIKMVRDEKAIAKKRAKIEKYMNYSRELGILEPENFQEETKKKVDELVDEFEIT